MDLIEEGDQITHNVNLDDTIDKQEHLDVFRVDENYLENEETWNKIKKTMLGEDDSDEEDAEDEYEDEEEEEEEYSEEGEEKVEDLLIEDQTEQDAINLRRTVLSISFQKSIIFRSIW